MRIGWVGVHAEGIAALEAVCAADYDVVGLLTLRPDKADRRCGSASYETICDRFGIPIHEIDHINDDTSIDLLNSWDCDLLVVFGWGQILKSQALQSARIGVVGAHASLLPHNRGSAPVNWAIIKGEQTTGNSLIWLVEGVDAGDLIDQRSFDITPFDTCATIYDKVAESNREMLLDLCFRLQSGDRPGRPQRHMNEPVLPRRRPGDGRIDWNASTQEIYNMVRALTRPYPGAFAKINGATFSVWKAAALPVMPSAATPGTVLGPVHSPESTACGVLVATGDGAIVLLELETSDGRVICGPELSEVFDSGRGNGSRAA